MKKVRIISLIAVFGVLVSILYAGVFAAAKSVKNVNVGGTITIPANLINVTVEGFLGDKAINTNDTPAYNSASNGTTWTMGTTGNNYLKYDLSDIDTASDFTAYNKDRYLTLRITNNNSLPLTASFKKTISAVETDFTTYAVSGTQLDPDITATVISGTNNVYTVSVPSKSGGVAGKAIIKVKFTLCKIIEDDMSIAFNYTLKLSDN